MSNMCLLLTDHPHIPKKNPGFSSILYENITSGLRKNTKFCECKIFIYFRFWCPLTWVFPKIKASLQGQELQKRLSS